MKFLLDEHHSIQKEIEKAGLNIDDFSFSKKKGVVYVQHKVMGTIFSFHRKIISHLNANGVFEDQTTYTLILQNKNQEYPAWKELLSVFANILKDLKKGPEP